MQEGCFHTKVEDEFNEQLQKLLEFADIGLEGHDEG